MRQSMRAARRCALVLIFTSVALLASIYSGRPVESKLKRATAPQTTDPATVGQWGPVQTLTVPDDPTTDVDETRVTPIHINLLPNGRLLLWGRDRDVFGLDVSGRSNAYVLDPFYMSLTSVRNNRTNIFCSGHSFLPDGRLIVTGGHDTIADRTREGIGSNHTNIFDYKTNQWEGNPIPGASPQPSPPPNMNNGRWYPYNLTLGNGETLVLSGSYLDTTQNTTQQNDIPQIRDAAGVWRNVKGVRETFHGSPLANYPYVHLAPNGWAYVAGSETQLNTYALIPSAITGEGSWFEGRRPGIFHWAGGSVQYEPGKLINIGGAGGVDGSFKRTDIIDFSVTNPTLATWSMGPDMTFGRNNHTSTLLPDGKVLVSGGSTCPGFSNLNCGPTGPANAPELWTPGGGWQTLASHQVPRVYHSIAILLPDGRVMVGGGGLPAHPGESPAPGVVCQPGDLRAVCRLYSHNDVEIFSPPYLFMPGGIAAPRPAIRYAPKEVTFGQSFDINVGSVTAQDVAEVVLVKLGAVTHGYNQDQRRVKLQINSRSMDGLTINVSAPADGNACPPGHYMLFLMKQNGVDKMTPSIAKIIRVSKVTTPDTVLAFPATVGSNSTVSKTLTVSGPDIWTAEVTKGDFLSVLKLGNQITITAQANWSTSTTPSERREGQVTIKVTGQPVFNHVIDVHQGKDFTDVSSPVIYEAASKLSAVKVTTGCTPGMYCPALNVSREEMAVLLIRSVLGGLEPSAVNRQSFEDVPVGHWSHKYVEDLFARNMTTGCTVTPRRFCPTAPVSRAELAVFILRVLNIVPPQPSGPTYSDSQQSWAYFFIEEATRQKLMGGCATTGAFCPDSPVTRAEAAETLARVLKL
jgi:hypothetical protein